MVEDEVPRAKRLKLLREAKARKERQLRGEEAYETECEAPVALKDAEKEQDADALEVAELSIAPKQDEEQDLTEKKDEGEDEEEDEEEELILAPKRANWDIERDIAPMLKKLEKRTQHAIVEILREKMAAEQQEEDDDGEGEEEGEDDDDEEEEEEEDEAKA